MDTSNLSKHVASLHGSNYLDTSSGIGSTEVDVNLQPLSFMALSKHSVIFLSVSIPDSPLTPSTSSILLIVDIDTPEHSFKSLTDFPVNARASLICIPVSCSLIFSILHIIAIKELLSTQKIDFSIKRSKMVHSYIKKPTKYTTTKQAKPNKAKHLKEIAL